MNRRQARKKRDHITGYGKDWRTWYKYHVPFYLWDFFGKEQRVASRHAYLNILYNKNLRVLVDRRRKTEIFIDTSCTESCYALGWSYGEICVNCGCCSDDPKTRYKKRIDYHMDMLNDSVTDNSREYHTKKIAEYRLKLKRLNEDEGE